MTAPSAILRETTSASTSSAELTGDRRPDSHDIDLRCIFSSLLHAWGSAGKYTLLPELLPDEQRLAANTLVSSLNFAATIAGPAIAGVLVTYVSSALVLGLDATLLGFYWMLFGIGAVLGGLAVGLRQLPLWPVTVVRGARRGRVRPAAGPTHEPIRNREARVTQPRLA